MKRQRRRDGIDLLPGGVEEEEEERRQEQEEEAEDLSIGLTPSSFVSSTNASLPALCRGASGSGGSPSALG